MLSKNANSEYIRTESVRMLFAHLLPMLSAVVLIACIVVYVLWDVVQQDRLVSWLVAIIFISILRIALYGRYKRPESDKSNPHWALYFVIGSLASGLLWGLAGIGLVPPGLLEYQLFVIFVIGGLGAGAISSLTAYLPAFYAFLICALVPTALSMIVLNETLPRALGVIVVIYTVALSVFAHNINASLRNSLELRFDNQALLEQLRKQKDEAESANMSKSRFLASASHDLRQPLHALSLFTQALQHQDINSSIRRIVNHIDTSVTTLEALFNAILDVSKLDAGVLRPEYTDFYVNTMLERLHNDFDGEAAQKGLRLHVVPTKLIINSDPIMLERVLRNLLSNAIRYSESGGIVLGCRRRANQVVIMVCDSGRGIPAQQREAIFEEFVQLDNPERDREKGLGLGLAIVRRMSRLLGHQVFVTSVEGRGSCFSVTVPKGHRTGERNIASDPQQRFYTGEGPSIFVVDDEALNREGLRNLLTAWGCRVEVAANIDEVNDLIERGIKPDAILADYRLRNTVTGIEVAQAVSTGLGVEVPTLILTGDTAPEVREKVESYGYQLVHKPVRAAILRAYLGRITKQPWQKQCEV